MRSTICRTTFLTHYALYHSPRPKTSSADSVSCQQLPCCRQCRLPAAAAPEKTNACRHRFKRQAFFVPILLLLTSNPRFDAHKFKASKLTWVDNRMIIRPPCLFLMRKVAKPQVLTEGEKDISFEILNQWISKRKLEISLNRIETQNPCSILTFLIPSVNGQCPRPATAVLPTVSAGSYYRVHKSESMSP